MGGRGPSVPASAGLVALALLLGAAPAAARTLAPRLGVPTVDPSGIVRWVARSNSLPGWAWGLVLPPVTRADSAALWRAAASQPHLRELATHRLAVMSLAAGDTARADSFWALAGAGRSQWTWPALRGRAELALARGAAATADSLLEHADRADWTAAERAAWLALRVLARAAADDTAQAIEFARQALSVYPSEPATLRSLSRLEELLRARGERLTFEDEIRAIWVDALRGEHASAARRVRRVLAERRAASLRWSDARLCLATLRQARCFAEARALADSVTPPDDYYRGWPLLLERARIEREAGRRDSALALYARFASDSISLAKVGSAAGRAAEDLGRWEEALSWYERTVRVTGDRSVESRFRAGLLHLALGRADQAAARWESDASDGARFWLGVTRRSAGDHRTGDSLLRVVAAQPGYSFYRAAARETLGVRGWPGEVRAAPAGAEDSCPMVRAAAELLAVGATADAVLLLPRLGARDEEGGAVTPGCHPAAQALAGARSAYAAGQPGLGMALAERALPGWDPDRVDQAVWQGVPWLFPPAYESLFVTPRDTVVASLEPALLFAVTHQESRFDARARSRSDALGLMQLKLATARDVARWAGDPPPTETALFDPERNVRYGARYLARLLRRFDGSVAAALSAYNAGPGSLSVRWRELRERGGEALLCELASNPIAQDYAQRILGHRQAYRELRPTAAP